MASEPPAQSLDPAETAQSAKRFVLSVIRNDWEWPPPEQGTVSGGENLTAQEQKQESLLAHRGPVGWRTRFEGASDLDLDVSPVTSTGRRKTKQGSDPYRFESPDAIANLIQEQRYKRKRENSEETAWNDGLRTWTERRDAWTAAQGNKPQKRPSADVESHGHTVSPLRTHKESYSSDESRHSQRAHDSAPKQTNGSQSGIGRRPSIAVDDTTDADNTLGDDDLNGPYLPIFPPLFPTSHTLRARIKPAAYPTIYSKVVVQSLTPNVPIPLTHMIGALVDGWKAEGNWPPQTLVEQQTHALLKRAKGAQKGETAFQKWRKERDAQKPRDDFLEDGFDGEMAIDDEEEKRGFRKSISGAVKKVFGRHGVVEEDGGLAKLGLSFDVHESEDDGALSSAMNGSEKM